MGNPIFVLWESFAHDVITMPDVNGDDLYNMRAAFIGGAIAAASVICKAAEGGRAELDRALKQLDALRNPDTWPPL